MPAGYWMAYKLRKQLQSNTTRYAKRIMKPDVIEQKRQLLIQLEQSFGRASQKHIVTPIVDVIKKTAEHQLAVLCGRVDENELATLGMSDPEKLVATLMAEVTIKARKKTLLDKIKQDKEQRKRDAKAAAVALNEESKKKKRKTRSESDAQ